jgi:hypothetical protein
LCIALVPHRLATVAWPALPLVPENQPRRRKPSTEWAKRLSLLMFFGLLAADCPLFQKVREAVLP